MMTSDKRQYIIGTAGHIDHGKTSLIIQLTGTDTDRLPEEKERGMTIDLGFAYLRDDITIIDVPGHEKFIRNMVAGVSTIDLVLFVIAADDGIMPQSREHLEILNLLQIQRGIIVITKCDLVDPDWLYLVEEDVKDLIEGTLLEHSPMVRVSNQTGQGIAELRKIIFSELDAIESKKDKGIFRLAIDRVFTMKGFGTVAAGTVLSGSIRQNDEVELMPAQKKLRVRGIQTHGRPVDVVKIGDRAAINLLGIEKGAIERGFVLAAPNYFVPTRFFDSKFYLLKSASHVLKNSTRVRIHIGTTEVMGKITILDRNTISPGESAYAQFKLEKEIVADFDDRFVVRSYSPVITIGGGKIVNPFPRKHKRLADETIESIRQIEDGDFPSLIHQIMGGKPYQLFSVSDISRILSHSSNETEGVVAALVASNDLKEIRAANQTLYILTGNYEMLKDSMMAFLSDYHQKFPAFKGITLSELKLSFKPNIDSLLLTHLIQDLSAEAKILRSADKFHLKDHMPQLSAQLEERLQQIERFVIDGQFAPPDFNELRDRSQLGDNEFNSILAILYETKKLVKLDTTIVIHSEMLNRSMDLIREFFASNDELTVGDCGKLLNTSRKFSLPLLNYLDSIGFTIRQHDVRVLNNEFNDQTMRA